MNWLNEQIALCKSHFSSYDMNIIDKDLVFPLVSDKDLVMSAVCGL